MCARPLCLIALLMTGCGIQPLPKLDDTAAAGKADGGDGAADGGSQVDTGLSDGGGSGGDGADGTDGGDGGDGADGGDGGSGDDGVLLEALAITNVDPDYGLVTGGDTITLFGGPFDSTAVVEIGGNPAVVQAATETTLTITTPASTRASAVRVAVETGTHEGTLDRAFTYFEDGRGYPGAVGVLDWFETIGTYWASQSGGGGGIWLSVPDTSFSWWEQYVPSLDTCRRDGSYTYPGTLYITDPGIASITLQPTSGSPMNLAYDAGGYFINTISASQVAAGRVWSLLPLTGSGLPEETIANFARMPSKPNVTSPSMTGSSVASVSPYFTVRWTPGGSDYVRITLFLNNGYGTDGFEQVDCFVNDDGSHQIDTSQFSYWPSSAQLNIQVSLVNDRPGGKLPWNQADSRVATMYGVIGAVFTN